jgi:hypothetical protein
MCRQFCFFALVVLVPLAVSQTSDELRAKYGSPLQEQFMLQPKIALAATYAENGEACQLKILPMYSLEARNDAMSTDSVSSLIEGLVPLATRGALINQTVTEAGCNTFTIMEYANVTISRAQHDCDPSASDRDIHAKISFKERRCAVVALRPLTR